MINRSTSGQNMSDNLRAATYCLAVLLCVSCTERTDVPVAEASAGVRQLIQPQSAAVALAVPQDTVPVKDFRLVSENNLAVVNPGQFYTTRYVDNLEPDSMATRFSPGEKVFVYAGVRTGKVEKVRFKWFDSEGEEILPSAYIQVKPNFGDVGFRVFTYRVFRASGSYEVALYNSAGIEIGRQGFEVRGTGAR